MPVTRHLAAVPTLRLTLHDGAERSYLLDDPLTVPTAAVPPQAVYEPRVHIAYLLARQGHHADWLARFTDLPYSAAHRITQAATPP
ncbi:hypothetical protein [Streptantibioticus cattleyicolor]|uniref:Uncharacterized protein n=1 Tax=Streptantibioticus cattleyicolor (strain ATCC 35852 / DSM 46488 / JCM 4925 / NBRC 14057 / NRRL 8057) TaxID=1003195 RepID=F8JJI6_STREN|nr:hypothetical protein [Streptantibioticus cattleyicolor]AEW98687.1 hypothetical protein SCATT_p04940 [Streptantibioticus cattleyicolor NRRL 8057 = DSM 46488]CCB72257.1 protein of unknown function [Streptantibioticus cattleyicolor NRRL 8057 = DSM 46488]